MLEEQKSVMEHCTAERRRLDAEWASFHSAEKQRQEQVEKVSSLLEKRESAIITLANVSLLLSSLYLLFYGCLDRFVQTGWTAYV